MTNCYFVDDNLILTSICILVVLLIQKVLLVSWFNGMKIYRLSCLCMFCFYFLFFIVFFFFFLGAATVLFLIAFVLYFHLEHVQHISFCRCFLIFNSVVLCVDDGIILWLKVKNSTSTNFKMICEKQ